MGIRFLWAALFFGHPFSEVIPFLRVSVFFGHPFSLGIRFLWSSLFFGHPINKVLDSDLGWTGFRPYDSETWAWVSAALRPRFLLSSGSMSEASLVRVAGQLSFNTTFKGIL